jgi:hypothetical protein
MKCNDDEKLQTFALRSIERIELLAHSRVGKCPACKFVITAESIAAAKADPARKFEVGWESNAAEWLVLHKSVQYGRTCLLSLEIHLWLLCLLHANLAVVRGLWGKTVVPYIDRAKGSLAGAKKKRAKTVAKVAATEPQGQQIFDLMKSYSIPIKLHTLEKASKNVEGGRVFLSTMMTQKFTGDGSRKLLHGKCEAAFKAFDIIAPNILPEDIARNKYLKDLWLSYYWVWNHLNGNVKLRRKRFKLDGKVTTDHEEWVRFEDDGFGGVKRAAFVAAYQVKFNTFFALWNSKHASEGLYLHILRVHAAPQMLQFGLLVAYQIQGLEHTNSVRKKVMKKTSKKRSVSVSKKGTKRKTAITGVTGGRLGQVMLHVAVGAYINDDAVVRSARWVKSEEANERQRENKRFKVEPTVVQSFKLEKS